MGLDQYLMRRIDESHVVEEIYWRKANFVHRYFTEGWEERGFESDDVTEFPVSKGDLEELLELCEVVLEDKRQAPFVLPTQSGFFFGSTEYDSWYFDDVLYTREQLLELLDDVSDDDEFYYYAWY